VRDLHGVVCQHTSGGIAVRISCRVVPVTLRNKARGASGQHQPPPDGHQISKQSGLARRRTCGARSMPQRAHVKYGDVTINGTGAFGQPDGGTDLRSAQAVNGFSDLESTVHAISTAVLCRPYPLNMRIS
jgi:hypothetical protein